MKSVFVQPKKKRITSWDYLNEQHWITKVTRFDLVIPIWVSYLVFVQEEYQNSKEDENDWMTVDRARSIYQQAVDTTQYHYQESHAVWNAYIDFELELIRQGHQGHLTVEKLRSLFLDRLQIPHQG